MTENIRNKVVVITGASSGLGEAAARLLAKEGAKLVLGARRLDRLQALAGELSLGKDAILQTDVTDVGQVRRLVDHAVKIHGRVDVIINNAGLMPHSPLERGKVVKKLGASPRNLWKMMDRNAAIGAEKLKARRAAARAIPLK